MIQFKWCVVFLLSFSASALAAENSCLMSGRYIHLGNDDRYPRLSPDKSYILYESHAETIFKIVDIKRNQIREFTKPQNVSALSILPDGTLFYVIRPTDSKFAKNAFESVDQAARSKTVTIDPLTGLTNKYPGKFFLNNELVSARAKDASTIVFTYPNGSEREEKVSYEDDPNLQVRYSEEEPEVTYDKTKKQLTFTTLDKKVLFSTPISTDMTHMSGGFSADTNIFLFQPDQKNRSELAIVDLSKKELKKIKVPQGYDGTFGHNQGAKRVSKDSRYLALRSYEENKLPKVLNLETGEIKDLFKHDVYSAEFDRNGNFCGHSIEAEKTMRKCYDVESGKLVSTTELPLRSDNIHAFPSDYYVQKTWGYGGVVSGILLSENKVCPKLIVPVDCNCLIPENKTKDASIEVVEDLAVANACGKTFDPYDWEHLTPPNPNTLDEKAALNWLKRFSKPGGFSEEHTGILLGMIKAGIHTRYPAKFKAALGGLVYKADRLYDSLVKKYPDLANLSGAPDHSCQTQKETEEINKAVLSLLKTRTLGERRLQFSKVKNHLSLAKDFLTETQRIALADSIGDQLVVSAGDSQELNQIFSSKVYKFAEKKVRSALGLEYKDITDITMVRDGNNLTLHQIGVNAFEGSKETIAGFHTKVVANIDVSKMISGSKTERYKWNYGGKEYSADVAISKRKLDKNIVSTAASPNYAEMMKEKTFRGVVIAGSNMGSGLTSTVMRQYTAYYLQQQFKFEEKDIDVPDIPKYLEGKVSGNEPMHYFVKEAHSDGDEKNIFRTALSGKIKRGIRTVGTKTEVIDLIYPNENSPTVLISNQDFGQWMRDREKKTKSELIYINSSCWSIGKAVYEVPAAATSKFINIPTTTSMETFVNKDNNVMKAVVDGVRNQRTYAAIRKDMEKDRDYKSGIENVFVFPDEEIYKRKISEVAKAPVDVGFKMFVNGKDGVRTPYSIEEEGH